MQLQLPAWMIDNFWLKALSLGVSVLLWVFVHIEERQEGVLRVHVRYQNVPQKLIIIGDPVPELQLVVDGPRTLIAQAEQGLRPYTIDLADAKQGIQQIRIVPNQLALPRGIDVVRIVPSVLEPELRPAVNTTVPVQVQLEGTVADGYEIVDVDVEPTAVELVAAVGDVKPGAALRTTPVNVDGLKSDWSGVVDLDLDAVHVKSITTREVDVFLRVAARTAERALVGVPVVVRGPGIGYRAHPATVELRVRGPENLVKKLQPEGLEAVVELKQEYRERSLQPVRVSLPESLTLLTVTPTRVTVTPRK